MRIENADAPEFLETVRTLFREYEASIKVDLCFQGFEKELAELPGEYARPSGRLLLAFEGDEAAGCGALRRLEGEVCEMKRLYVSPEHQGKVDWSGAGAGADRTSERSGLRANAAGHDAVDGASDRDVPVAGISRDSGVPIQSCAGGSVF